MWALSEPSEPGMTEHFLNIEPLLSLYLYHIFKEVLELLHQRVFLQLQLAQRPLVDPPKLPSTPRSQQTVDLILRQRKLKRQSSQNKSKQHYSKCEDISSFRIIVLAAIDANCMNLWGHISPSGSFEAIGE